MSYEWRLAILTMSVFLSVLLGLLTVGVMIGWVATKSGWLP